MKNADLPAAPSGVLQDGYNYGHYPLNVGLTKREMFAMAAMQGLCANNNEYNSYQHLANSALCHADALLAELERTK